MACQRGRWVSRRGGTWTRRRLDRPPGPASGSATPSTRRAWPDSRASRCADPRAPGSPARAGLRRRRSLKPRAPRCADPAGRAARHGGVARALLYGRPRHFPRAAVGFVQTVEEWCAAPRDLRQRRRRAIAVTGADRARRQRHWTVLRHGPGPSLERIQRAYDLLVHGRAEHHARTALEAVEAAYRRGESDEFVRPTGVGEPAPIGPRRQRPCFNFRPDRMRELVRALAEPGFGEGDEALPRLERSRGRPRSSISRP